MPGANVKQQIHELIDKLPDNVTWRDAVYEMVKRREIELGLADSDADRITAAEDVLKDYGFDQ